MTVDTSVAICLVQPIISYANWFWAFRSFFIYSNDGAGRRQSGPACGDNPWIRNQPASSPVPGEKSQNGAVWCKMVQISGARAHQAWFWADLWDKTIRQVASFVLSIHFTNQSFCYSCYIEVRSMTEIVCWEDLDRILRRSAGVWTWRGRQGFVISES